MGLAASVELEERVGLVESAELVVLAELEGPAASEELAESVEQAG